jgi:predicted MFS family arabinose efflux permease
MPSSRNQSNQRIALPSAFRRLAWSNLLAQSAEQISLAAAPLVAVFLLGASAAQTGLLQTAQTLPFLLLSLPMGVYADRHSRRGLMASAEAVRVLAMIMILVLIGAHLLTLPMLAVCGFIGAAGTVAYSVAAPSLVPSLVPRDALPAANGRIELARSVAYSAGPAIGGVIVGSVGAGWAYALATMLSAFAVVLLRALPVSAHLPRTGRHFLAEVREGAAFVFRDPLLRPILLTAVFFNLGYFVLQAIYVAYAAHHLHMSSWVIGVSLAAYGAGMVAGALAGPEVSRRVSFGRTLVIGPMCGFLASVLMSATLFFPQVWMACVSFFLLGAGPVLWTIGSTTLRQAITPHAMLGRVSAIMSTATYGARPVGALLGAALATQTGVSACLLMSTVAFAIQLGVIVVSPVTQLAALPEGA